jgi:3-oxoacyl-[acyl-carrier-protein] synthase II
MSQKRRVVITGVGLNTPLGNTLPEVFQNVAEGRSGCSYMSQWDSSHLRTRIGSVVKNFDEKSIPRQFRRSMSRVALLATDATSKAISDAGLKETDLQNERTGVAYGSTMGGTSAIEKFFDGLSSDNPTNAILSSTFLQIMSHTCAASLVMTYRIPGRVIASCVACAASTQAIGFGYEAIRNGEVDRMVCGGAEEMHISMTLVFDSLHATTHLYNSTPSLTPRPFSRDRDGLVVGEGACTFILEDLESALARGAKPYAEIIGFCTNADGNHMTNPSVDGMERVMRGAIASAGLQASDIDYVNAHATATPVGDVAESKAILRALGPDVPVSSLKGHFGHLMGACGAVESAVCLGMMRENLLVPTLHLSEVDPECGQLNYLKGGTTAARVDTVLKNSFAFGGINASLVLRKI